MLNVKMFSIDLPRQLQKQTTVGPSEICNILQLVSKLLKLLLNQIKGLGNLVLSKDSILKLSSSLVPESVDNRCIGESVARLRQSLYINNSVRPRRLLSSLKRPCNLSNKGLLVLVTCSLETLYKLCIALLALLLVLLHDLGLGLTQLARGDDLGERHSG